jgi:hypothetical protein
MALMRNTVITLAGAWGTEGGQFTFGTAWSY